MRSNLIEDIFSVPAAAFESRALEVFQYQYDNNIVYHDFCKSLKRSVENVKHLVDIPFLPIQFFKTKSIIAGEFVPTITFESSGTTGSINSKHFLKNGDIYTEGFIKTFQKFYGNVEDYCVVGLLPSYLERQSSSLVYMVKQLIELSKNVNSGFYLYDHEKLQHTILENESHQQKTILIGVTYALLDFAEKFSMQLKHTIIMETGGMKGRREELTRQEVHEQLTRQLGTEKIHSEYGMTELLSQAYSHGDGIFNCPNYMQIVLRETDDPFEITTTQNFPKEKKFASGAINIIDLANVESCAFIATDDIGKLYPDGQFEVLGRMDNSDTRGCGLMIV